MWNADFKKLFGSTLKSGLVVTLYCHQSSNFSRRSQADLNIHIAKKIADSNRKNSQTLTLSSSICWFLFHAITQTEGAKR